jgi:hypothetical protein
MYNSDFSDSNKEQTCATILSTGDIMKPTQLLKYLIEQLKDANLITYNQDFISLIFEHMDTQLSKKQLSGYITRIGNISNRQILLAIERKFGFKKEIWKRNDAYQSEQIHKAINNLLELKKLPTKTALDISDIIQTRKPINEIQFQFLEQFKESKKSQKEEEIIDTILKRGLLTKKVENQEFMVKLLQLAYKKGLYGIIIEFILPNMFRDYQKLPEVQKIEAHTLGSLGKYEDAKHILGDLVYYNTIENINLRTAALSNHKRALLESDVSIEADTLFTLIRGYTEIHSIDGIYSYYTGINLLYMVILGQTVFPNDTRFKDIENKKIYELSKLSLQNDTTHETYYTTMSDFEFQLLLGRESILEKIEHFLENDAPHFSLVERTARQMKLFTSNLKDYPYEIKYFNKAIAILESYCQMSDKLP